jgi:CRISPR-associated protein Cas1
VPGEVEQSALALSAGLNGNIEEAPLSVESEPVELPELLPARMLNEFTYCPRLFFLEWVSQQFAHSDDTVEGLWHHRAVDSPSGPAPLPGEGELRITRSLMLSSPRLGLVSKIDLVEPGPDGLVAPVDTKHGSPPNIPERAWEPERVQLCVQGLLLREHGYLCDYGYLWFADARQRVRVDFDDALVRRTLALLEEARHVARQETPPPPLIDSPKCPRCSLVGICLPDELNVLAARAAMPPRRLLPRDSEARPLYVTEQGASLTKDGGRVLVRRGDEILASTRLIDVSQVCLYGNVQISAQLLRELLGREVPVCWFSAGGWFAGMATGLPGRNVELRRRQVITAAEGNLALSTRIVEAKIRNCRTLLRRNTRERSDAVLEQLRRLAQRATEAQRIEELLGIEGAAGRIYFGAFPTMLRSDKRLPGEAFHFDGRKRRPPPDAVNCLLGYVYGLLVKELTVIAFAVGFDPYLGFYHRPRFGRPALALDLAEEFRPIVGDSVVINLINNGEISAGDFIVRAGGVTLTKSGRRAVLAAYERRLATEVTHPVFGYKVSYRRVLEVQLRLLGAHLLGEVADYTPFTTR